jgi:hypothetical protein
MNDETIDLWAAPQAVHEYLERRLPEGAHILELGSGSGTTRLVEHYEFQVTTVEHDPEYLNKCAGATYIHAPIISGWYDTSILRTELPAGYDVLLVDGPTGAIGRGGLFSNLDLFDTSKPMIFDDVNRQPEYELATKVSRYLGVGISYHLLADGRAFATVGFEP